MSEVHLNKKLSGLYPFDDWKNPKGHLSALTKGGNVITYAECNLGGHSRFSKYRGRSCHSEIAVLKGFIFDKKMKRKISKYTIWNIRWSNGKILNSKPCLHCQKILLKFGIKNIVFSTDNGIFIKNNISELDCKYSSGFR